MSCFSLRGKVSMPDNSRVNPTRIFDYVSPDRTRAWKVTRAYVWPITIRADTSTNADGKYLAAWTLYTDDGSAVIWNDVSDPTENRAFAWSHWAGYCRDNGSDDFITPEAQHGIAEFVIDPDTLIVKELWIGGSCTKEGTTNPTREWGYMIILEENKISPSQSVFQQIKGMGQNVVAKS